MRYDRFAVQPEVAMIARGIVDNLKLMSCPLLKAKGVFPSCPAKTAGQFTPKYLLRGIVIFGYELCFVQEKDAVLLTDIWRQSCQIFKYFLTIVRRKKYLKFLQKLVLIFHPL